MSYCICKYQTCYIFSNFLIYLQCLPERQVFFSTGSSYPPSTLASGSRAISEPQSEIPTKGSVVTSGSKRSGVNDELLRQLKLAGLTVNENLCYVTNPPLSVMYQRFLHVNDLNDRIRDIVADGKWPLGLGKPPNQTEIISLFVSKTTWHDVYAKVFPVAEKFDDMQAWLTGNSDRKSEIEIWGAVKSKYTIGDLKGWIKQRAGDEEDEESSSASSASPATPAKSTKGKAKATGSGTKKGKEKATEVKKGKEKAAESASGSTSKKGNVKKVVVEKKADNKKDHKKKKTAASSRG